MVALPPPEESALARASATSARRLCGAYLDLWRLLVIDRATLPVDHIEVAGVDGARRGLRGAELLDCVFSVVVRHFDYALGVYLRKSVANRLQSIPGLTLDAVRLYGRSEADGDLPDDLAERIAVLTRSIFSRDYLGCAFGLEAVNMCRSWSFSGSLTGTVEWFLHKELHDYYQFAQSQHTHVTPWLRDLIPAMGARLLDHAAGVYGRVPKWDEDSMAGPFSSIRLVELPLLAKRDPAMLDRYGAGQVAKAFEKQLALIVQSFGFIVVSTRTGTETVDLVCISPDPAERFTFLLEAKTTRSKYALPKKDARALCDYVTDVRRTLTTLPPLTFGLLVGPEPATTVAPKLSELGLRVNLPLRYCPASLLGTLRARLPGPLPLRAFQTEILRGPAVLAADFITAVHHAHAAEQQAHVDFVRSMQTARTVLSAQLLPKAGGSDVGP